MAPEPRHPDTPFWVDPGGVRGSRLHLGEEESRHLLKVYRAGRGTEFEAVDGEGTLYRCVLDAVENQEVLGRIEERVRDAGELAGSIHLLVGAPDVPAAEAVVSRATPLGATAIEFVWTERGEPWKASDARLARLTRLARAALKQCRRTRLPRLAFTRTLAAATAALPDGRRILADASGAPWSESALSGVLQAMVLAVGPPGGFSPEELGHLRTSGFYPISLGPNRLTTEDAAAALLALSRQAILSSGRARH